MVRSLGANRVIDYTQEDFTESGQRYEVIFDCVANHSLSECRRALTPKGICIVATGPNGKSIGPLARFIQALALSLFVSQKLAPIVARPNKRDLTTIRDLLATGKVIPVIDRCYSLREVPSAVRYLEQGHARGKVVVQNLETP